MEMDHTNEDRQRGWRSFYREAAGMQTTYRRKRTSSPVRHGKRASRWRHIIIAQ
jgi:hypothetical protein